MVLFYWERKTKIEEEKNYPSLILNETIFYVYADMFENHLIAVR